MGLARQEVLSADLLRHRPRLRRRQLLRPTNSTVVSPAVTLTATLAAPTVIAAALTDAGKQTASPATTIRPASAVSAAALAAAATVSSLNSCGQRRAAAVDGGSYCVG